MDIEAMMSAMSKKAGQQSRSEHEDDGYTDVQVVARLLDCFTNMEDAHEFTPGQIILHKFPSLAGTRSGDRPAVYLRKLDPPIAVKDYVDDASDMYSNSATAVFDMVLGKIMTGTFCEYFGQSKEYKPHPDFP